jgi:hypothetical protein
MLKLVTTKLAYYSKLLIMLSKNDDCHDHEQDNDDNHDNDNDGD